MLPIDEKPSTDLKTALDPYMLEAGLDPDQLSFSQNRKLIVESLTTFHVIDKRRLALDDIIKGNRKIMIFSIFLSQSNVQIS